MTDQLTSNLLTRPEAKLRISDSQLAGEIAYLQDVRLNPVGLSTREAVLLLALWELRERRGEDETTTPQRYDDADIRFFLGWLSVELPELHSIETPRLGAAWDKWSSDWNGENGGVAQP